MTDVESRAFGNRTQLVYASRHHWGRGLAVDAFYQTDLCGLAKHLIA